MDREIVELGDKLNQGFITRREFMRRALVITPGLVGSFLIAPERKLRSS